MRRQTTAKWVLLAFLNQIFMPLLAFADDRAEQYGVVFLGVPTQKQTKAFKVLGKRVQTWMENGPFGKVEVKTLSGTASETELLMEQLKVQIEEYTRTLKKAVLESSDKSKGEKSLAEIKSLRKKMNITGRFGPVLQKSYLAEAALHWKNEKFSESEAALKKALELDPMGKPKLDDWDMFAASFSVFAFEKEVSRVYQKISSYCDTSISVKQKNVQLKVNGFDLNEKRNVKLATNAMHVISIRDDKGHSQESVLHCLKKSQKKVVLDLLKNPVTSSEMSLAEALENSKTRGLFIASFKKENLELYFYTRKVGSTPVLLERKISEGELADASLDFKLPVSYSSMNSTLSKHYGANAILLSGGGYKPAGSTLEEKFRNSGNKWYNNPIVWGVVGGLAAGATTAYLLTREGNSPVPQATVTMEVQ